MTVTTNAATLLVELGASVTATSGDAVKVAVDAPSDIALRSATIDVRGSIDGNSGAGIALTDGTLPDGYYGISTQTDITVGATGSITGDKAILLGPVEGVTSYTYATLDNAGTISATAGPAVVSEGTYVSFTSIINRESGTIDGISGAFTAIDNAGLIDGGSGSAIEGVGYTTGYPNSITNSGRIASSGSTATINNVGMEIINGGEIANGGAGAAVSGSSNFVVWVANQADGTITSSEGSTLSGGSQLYLSNAGTVASLGSGMALDSNAIDVINEAGGTISASGTVISATQSLNLVNHGLISGDVLAGSSDIYGGSSVDTTAGTIDGDLLFGDRGDLLYAIYDDSGNLFTGVTGAVDGGAGNDTVNISLDGDRTLDTAILLPTNFETLAFSFDSDATVTLAEGFSTYGGISLAASGTFRNETSLSAEDTVIRSGYSGASGSLMVENAGTITSTGGSDIYALHLSSGASFTNTGKIHSDGAGVQQSGGAFDNSGMIEATGTALAISLIGVATNSGKIRSIEGTGLDISGSAGEFFTNTGAVEGGVVGATLTAELVNDGEIYSPETAVLLGSSGILNNREGGTVTGGKMAVAPKGRTIFGASVLNAGTINGDVSFGNSYVSQYDNNNIYYALAGGVLNGDLTLGKGDYLVTNITNDGDGEYAGINGTVSATGSYLRYEVLADTSAILDLPDGFASVAYQLHEDAELTLTGEEPYTAGLLLSGRGSVDLSADIDVVDSYAMLSTGMVSALPDAFEGNSLDILNRGRITATRTGADEYYGLTAIMLGQDDSLTNEGTITLNNLGDVNYNPSTAITGGAVFNTGLIDVDGGNAVSYAASLENSGTITASGFGVYGLSNTAITNSGTISSFQSAAIQLTGGYASTIDNMADGTISGGNGSAIQARGGTVRNAGAILGDVDLGWSANGYSATSATYYADGGTIEGDLLFGSGNDILIETGAGFGVSGTIEGGDGYDVLGHMLSTSGTVELGKGLPTGFESEVAGARGSDTIVTITGAEVQSRDILLAGNGQIVNRAATSGMLTDYAFASDSDLFANFSGPLASVSNEADIGGGIVLATHALSNTATVGSDTFLGTALRQTANGSLAFDNSGTIAAAAGGVVLDIWGNELTSGTFVNSGTIVGGAATINYSVDSEVESPSFTFANSGEISVGSGLRIIPQQSESGLGANYSLAFDNSGSLTSTADGYATLELQGGAKSEITLSNSGTIKNEGAGGETWRLSYVWVPYAPYYEIISQRAFRIASAVSISGAEGSGRRTSMVNSGEIEASGVYSTAVQVRGALNLINSGTITGTQGFTLEEDDPAAASYGTTQIAGAVQTFGGQADSISNSGTIVGSIDLGGGDDKIVNTGTIRGDIRFGTGNDSFTHLISAIYEGTADGGQGKDTFLLDITGGGTINEAIYDQLVNFEVLSITGTGAVDVEGPLPFETIEVGGSEQLEFAEGAVIQALGPVALTGSAEDNRVVNRGTILGAVDLGSGNDSFANSGTITGLVDLGEGDDELLLSGNWAAMGGAVGGAGTDTLGAVFTGTAQNPTELDLGQFQQFEIFAHNGGTAAISGSLTFQQIDVIGGYLFGRAGSVINGNVGVAAGATFGSAGTVNGDIEVMGTLSPGASPGTLTVNGDVALGDGSITLFEMTPTISDAIVINGALTIDDGATLNITGTRPLTPGVSYDLITAAGGIDGTFETINKAASVQGYISYTDIAVQLLGTFQLEAGASLQGQSAVDYLNGLLIAGDAPEGVTAAIPDLLHTDGFVNEAAILSITPEAYASAVQMGMENGLAISAALRSADVAADGGLFTFGQGFGQWRDFVADAEVGTATANTRSAGVTGGVGFGSDRFSITGFIGNVDARQRVSGRASNNADGIFYGGRIAANMGGLRAGAAVIWDRSEAETDRSLFTGVASSAEYDLHSRTIDGYLGYDFAAGGGWQVGPEAGLTHIRVTRDAVSESGGGAFALDVDAQSYDATFLSGDVVLTRAPTESWLPYLAVGFRHMLSGDGTMATGRLAGVAGSFAAQGAQRDDTFAHIGTGVSFRLTPSLSVYSRADGEFGEANNAMSASGGLRLSF